MTAIEAQHASAQGPFSAPQPHVAVCDGRLVVSGRDWCHRFHALWLRQSSRDVADIDVRNGQRLFEAVDISDGLRVVTATLLEHGAVAVEFDDGAVRRFPIATLERAARRATAGDELPDPEPWTGAIATPTIVWDAVDRRDADEMLHVLEVFHRRGWFVITGAPTAAGSLVDVASRFGDVTATGFGTVFDVVSEPSPIDLAYTSVALSAHTDQPYRRATPGIQFLHVLANEAAGGHSTIVDGLAAIAALRRHDPDGFLLLSTIPVEFRYDIGTDVAIDAAPMIDLAPDGTLRQLRFSPRLDFVPALDVEVLDRFFAARRWLAAWCADRAHRIEFKLHAGDVLVVDNHRVLHGRTAFDPTSGHRHLQGCYVGHDGPATMWRVLRRTTAAG